jgi:hypothetical protein
MPLASPSSVSASRMELISLAPPTDAHATQIHEADAIALLRILRLDEIEQLLNAHVQTLRERQREHGGRDEYAVLHGVDGLAGNTGH